MEIRVLNSSLVATDVVDYVESFIWTERFNDVGDFEIYHPFTAELFAIFQVDSIISIPQSSRMMIIDTVQIKTNPETGNKLLVKGRSLESVLDRRIVLRQIQLDGTFQAGIQGLLNENVISGLYPERNFPNFIFTASADPLVTTPTLKAQFYSENLLETIIFLCKQYGLGFKVTINASNQWVFQLYAGVDRSYAQSTQTYVVFSPNFDNLINSEFFFTARYRKNAALISGDKTTGLPEREQVFLPEASLQGFHRREMFVDASDMTRYLEGTTTEIPILDYLEQLKQRGAQELAQNANITTFDGQIDISRTYEYGVDFGLGDMVQLENEYGQAVSSQIIEMTFSENLQGYTVYPTLKTL